MDRGQIRFTKMQGLGNDYIYLDGFETAIDLDQASEWAKKVSDRHFGIGGDGLVLMLPSEKYHCKMRIFNADGSEAQMCGNAIRCVAKYLEDRRGISGPNLIVDTLAGPREIQIVRHEGSTTWVKVNMGTPIFSSERLPMTGPSRRVIMEPIEIAGEKLKITCVSMGNPHCVTFVDELTDTMVSGLGPQIERSPVFPERINVEFVQVINRSRINMRVWERGSGETLACGTGASASAVAAILNGYCDPKVKVGLLGGELEIEWEPQGDVFMTGPAVEVFQGTILRP